MRACAYRIDLKSSQSRRTSSSSNDGSKIADLKVDFELRVHRKYVLVRQPREGDIKVVEHSQAPPQSRTFRSAHFFQGIPNPSGMLASFGIEADALPQDFRRRIVSFAREKTVEAMTTKNNELKIFLVINILCWEALDHDAALEQAVRESLEHLIRLRASLESLIEEKLKKVRYEGDEELGSDCPICLDEFSMKQNVILMPCGHGFHYGCIIRWLMKRSSCPMCRLQL